MKHDILICIDRVVFSIIWLITRKVSVDGSTAPSPKCLLLILLYEGDKARRMCEVPCICMQHDAENEKNKQFG